MNSHFVFRAAVVALTTALLPAVATAAFGEPATENQELNSSGGISSSPFGAKPENTQKTASPASAASDQQNSQMNTANDHIMSIPATNPSGGGGAPPI